MKTSPLFRTRLPIFSKYFSTAQLALAPLLALLVFLLGCQPPAENGPAADSQTQGDSGAANTKRYKIAVVPKGTTHVFWKSVHYGAAKAAEEFGAEILFQGPQKEDDRDQQISLVQSLTIKGVDGICLAPLDSEALVRPVEEAKKAGIPTVIFDSGLKAPDTIVSYVATDNFLGGQMAAEAMAKALSEKGRVIMLRYAVGSESTEQREEGFLAKIKEYPQIEVLSSDQYAGTSVMSSVDKTQQLFQRFDNKVDGIFAVCESNADGVLKAIEDSGLAGKIVFVGFDPSETLRAALTEKKMSAIILQDPVNMGYQAVKTMIEHLNGKEVEKRIDTGEFIATPENLNDEKMKTLLNPAQK
jgi:ribose transport system substrate-binding protein